VPVPRAALVLAIVLGGPAGPLPIPWAAAAMQMTLDPRAVDEAIAIGQSRIDVQRTRFHAPYRLAVGRAPLDYIEVITPFRRVALAAEARTRVGDRSFGQRQAFELLSTASNQLELWFELTFHPLNTLVGVPAYDIALEPSGGGRILPRTVNRIPRYGARVEGELPFPAPGSALPGGSQPMLGGIVITEFDGRVLDATGAYDVVVREAGKELARVRLELGRVR
jgi:hypothetical protein